MSRDWSLIPVREITSRLDRALPGLLDIYQKSFPLVEQTRISFFLRTLAQKESGGAPRFHLDVLASEDGEDVAGFALYAIGDEAIEGLGRGGYLWFLAADADLRGQGIGARLYAHVRAAMFGRHGCRALFFEIEDPAEALEREGRAAADYADWRKAWYKRQGARELQGTRYLCGSDWHPGIPMQIMVHPSEPTLTAEEALQMSRVVLNAEIDVTGDLGLV